MRNSLKLLMIALAITLPGWAQTPTAGQGFHMAGRVVDALTGKPLNRMVVEIGKPLSTESAASVVTGADGRFAFSNLEQGKYWLATQGKGIPRQAYQEHGFYSTAIAVGPAVESDGIEFKVNPDSSIAGVITDQNGEGIRDAQVMLFRRGLENGKRVTVMQEEANSNDEGRYHFSHVQAGTYFIVVSAKPWFAPYTQGVLQQTGFKNQEHRAALDVVYPITYYPGGSDAGGATPILVKSGEHVSADVTLTPEPAQHFKVTDPDAGQDQGMNVLLEQRVFDGFPVNVQAQAVATAPGEVEIAGVAEGHYRMQVQSYGKNSSTRTEEVDVSNGAELRASGSVAAAEVTGIVKRQSSGGDPVIRLTNVATRDVFDGQVSKKGTFKMDAEALPPGKYDVEVLNLEHAVVKNVAATGARASGQTVEISGGGAVRLTITLAEQLSRVDGIALRDGKGAGGAMIVLIPQDLEHNVSLARRDQSDSDGTFSLYAVPAGKYTVVAIENGWTLEWQDRDVIAPYLKNGTAVEVGTDKGSLKVTVQ